MAFSPAIAAVVVRRWITREGFQDAGLAPRVRTAASYYLLAWFGPALVFAATVALAALLGLYDPDFSSLSQLFPGMRFAHAANNMIIGTLSSALLVEAGGLDSATVELLGLIPLAAICAWILLTGQLSAPSDSGQRTLIGLARRQCR